MKQIPLFRFKSTFDKFPKLKIEFAERAPLISKLRTQINMMKNYFNNYLPEGTVFTPKSGTGKVLLPVNRYNLDLFFIELYDLFHKCDNKSKILHFIGT